MVNGFRFGGPIAVAIFALLLAAKPVTAAKRLEPPSLFLTAEENRVAVVETMEISMGDALFARREALHGETPERVRVRLDAGSLERLRAGGTYVLGYTVLRRDRRRAPVFELDPKGPRIVEIPAVGPALFVDSPEVRRLIEAVEGPASPDRDGLLRAIVGQLERPDPASRRLVAAELVLRPKLVEIAGSPELAVLRGVLESETLEVVTTDYLLRALRPLAERGAVEWLRPIGLTLVTQHDRRLDLASMTPALLETVLEVLADVGRSDDAAVVVEHLYSNNPGVGREAMKSLAALDPELAARAAVEALERGGTHADVEREIRRWLTDRGTGSGEVGPAR